MNEFQKSGRVARSNYDRLSRWYDLLAAGSERRAQVAGLELLKVKEGDIVLEIGSGTGQALLTLGRAAGSSGQAIGIDRSSGMISQAAARLRKANLSQRTTLVCGDAIQLPFQGEFCVAVFLSFTLELFPEGEIVTVLSECRRVLRNGGTLCVVAMDKLANPGLITRAYEWAHRKYPELIDCRPIDVLRVVSRAGFQLRDVSELHMWGLPIRIVLAANIKVSV
jgi:demethylmenaquinone methyltransferase/2-methoxy-6-polyprenyl-1,4-benzoquinol methylase